MHEIWIDARQAAERSKPSGLCRRANAVMLDRKPVVKPRRGILQGIERIERHVDRLITISMRVNLDTVSPERQHTIEHILPGNLSGQALLAVQVAGKIQTQGH